MRAYLQGDLAAFDGLYARHKARIYAYVRKHIYNKAEADEVFQSVWLKFHASRGRYLPRYPVLQWLYVIGRSVTFDHLRRQRKEIGEALLAQVESTESSTQDSLPEELLAGLDERSRRVLEERYLDERSFEEIAQRLGLSQAGVRQIVSRALKKLRAKGNA